MMIDEEIYSRLGPQAKIISKLHCKPDLFVSAMIKENVDCVQQELHRHRSQLMLSGIRK